MESVTLPTLHSKIDQQSVFPIAARPPLITFIKILLSNLMMKARNHSKNNFKISIKLWTSGPIVTKSAGVLSEHLTGLYFNAH